MKTCINSPFMFYWETSKGSCWRHLCVGGLRGCSLPPCGGMLVSQDDTFDIILKYQRCKVANRGVRLAFKKTTEDTSKRGKWFGCQSTKKKSFAFNKIPHFFYKFLKIPTKRKHSDDFSSHPCVRFTWQAPLSQPRVSSLNHGKTRVNSRDFDYSECAEFDK